MDELWMIELFKQFKLDDKAQLLDVGANVGQTLLKWKSVYASNAYFGIEPIPACHYYLQTLAKSNDFKNCSFLQKALSDRKGSQDLQFHYKDNTDRTATIAPSNLKALSSVKVDLIDFPTMVEETNLDVKNVSIVKIDTEGSEVQILKSMNDFIHEFHPKILVEVLAENNNAAARVSEFNTIIQKLPYTLYRIKKKGFHLDRLEKIDEISIPTKVVDSDYLLLPL